MLSAHDLQIRHRPAPQIDLVRLQIGACVLVLDAEGRDAGAVRGDVVVLEWIRDRIAHTFSVRDARRIDRRIAAMRAAAERGRFGSGSRTAEQICDQLVA